MEQMIKNHKIVESIYYEDELDRDMFIYRFKCDRGTVELKPDMDLDDLFECQYIETDANLIIDSITAEVTYCNNALLAAALNSDLDKHYTRVRDKVSKAFGYNDYCFDTYNYREGRSYLLNKHCPQCGDMVLTFDIPFLSSIARLGGSDGVNAYFRLLGFEFTVDTE